MFKMIRLLWCALCLYLILLSSSKACELDFQYSYIFESEIHQQVARRLMPNLRWPPERPSVQKGQEVVAFKPPYANEDFATTELPKKILGAVFELERYLHGCDDQVANLIYELHNYKHHFKKFAEIKGQIQYVPGPGVTQEDLAPLIKTMKEIQYQFGAHEKPREHSDHTIEITVKLTKTGSGGKPINYLKYKESNINRIHYTYTTSSLLSNDLKALDSIRILTQSLVTHLPRRFHRGFNTPLSYLGLFIDKYHSSGLEKNLKLFILIIFMIYVTIHFSKIKEVFLRRG